MASQPPAPLMPDASVLMTLGMFLFGMGTMAYSEFQRQMAWRHPSSERFMERAASQYVGPGDDNISLSGHLVPEVAGSYSAIERLTEMANTGDNWPLVDGMGRVLGNYRVVRLDQTHVAIMAGGLPRAVQFTIELERAPDTPQQASAAPQ